MPAGKRIRALLAAVALPLALLAAAGCQDAGDQDGQHRSAGGETPLFGFGDSSPIYPYRGSPSAQQLARLARGAGAEVLRFTIRWEVVQSRPPATGEEPRYDFSRFDPLVDAARSQGISVLPVLLGAPAWARDPAEPCPGGVCPPARDRLGAWRGFVGAVARRYRDAAVALEVWNEPNRQPSWAVPGGPDPARYAALLGEAAAAVSAAAPGKTVLLGGLSPGVGERGALPLATFVQGVEEARPGLGDGMLAGAPVGLGAHLYPRLEEVGAAGPGARFERDLTAALEAARRLTPGSGLWVTEFGASTTAGPGAPGAAATDRQALALEAMLERLERESSIAATLVYTLVDREPRPDQPAEEGFGVVGAGPAFELKPAYCRLAEARAQRPTPGCAGEARGD